MIKSSRKPETSKQILWASYAIALFLTGVVIWCTLRSIDCANVTTIAGAAWLELSASNVFYYNMCRHLNAPKVVMGIYKDLPEELKKQIDVNGLLSNLIN